MDQYRRSSYIVTWKAVVLMIVSAVLGGVISAAIFIYADTTDVLPSPNVPDAGVQLDLSDLPDVSAVAVAVAEKVRPSVVSIDSTGTYNMPFQGMSKEVPLGSGSGVIYSADGYIITNNHVVEGATSLTVTLADGTIYDAKIIGTDSRTDLAVIKIDATGLPVSEFGDSSKLRVGEFAMAVGNPGGSAFAGSATQGSISGTDRTLSTGDGYHYELVQTDAAINPGNSGGALVNAKGEVIGINTVKIADTNFEGMGFAIPSNLVIKIANELIANGFVTRPALGVSLIAEVTPEIAEYNKLPVDYGVLVAVTEGGGAASAGIKNYDIIVALDGTKVTDFATLQQTIFAKNVGDKVQVTVQRGSDQLTVEVELGSLSR